MDELRWFLLILGLVVIAAVYVYSRWQDWRHDGPPWRRRRRETREPFAEDRLSDEELRGALDELDTLITEDRGERPDSTAEPRTDTTTAARESDEWPAAEAEPLPEDFAPLEDEVPSTPAAADKPALEEEAEPPPAAAPQRSQSAVGAMQQRLRRAFRAGAEATHEPEEPVDETPVGEEKVIALTVMAPEGLVFAGDAVVEGLEACGLRHGEHGIYHRTLDTRTGPVALYSVANVVEPGWFDLDHIEDMTTPGVALFLQLPGPFDGLAAFEQMLQTARSLTQQLGGHLLDARRCDLTQQAIEHLREELVEYRRRAHIAARQAR